MKKDYAEELKKIYTESRGRYAAINAEAAKAREEYERKRYDSTAKPYEVEYLSKRYEDKAAKRRKEVEELRKETQKRIDAITAEYERELREYYAVDSSAIDSNVVYLLNSGIMKAADFKKVAAEYRDNTTMLRLISKAMRDSIRDQEFKNMTDDEQERYTMSNAINDVIKPDDRIRQFHTVTSVLNETIPEAESDINRGDAFAALFEGDGIATIESISQYPEYAPIE